MASDKSERSCPAGSSDAASTTYSAIYVTAHNEYIRFIKFVQKLAEPMQSFITGLLFPLYVHVYILLFREEKFAEAQKFLRDFAEPFLKVDGYGEAILTLSKFRCIEDFRKDSYFRGFCDSKYIVKASEESLKLMNEHFEDTDCKILPSIIPLYIHIKIVEDHECSEEVPRNVSVQKRDSCKTKTAEVELCQLKTAIVKEGKLVDNFPYCLYVTCGEDILSAAEVNTRGNLLACGFSSSVVRLWHLNLIPGRVGRLSMSSDDNLKESPSSTSDDESDTYSRSYMVLNGHLACINGAAFTRSADVLMTCSDDCTVRAWKLKTHNELGMEGVVVYRSENSPLWDVTISGNSSYFATASENCTAHLWDFERQNPLRILSGHSASVKCVKFHSNSKYLATSSSDGTIRMWTVDDGSSVREFKGHQASVDTITFSPNGKYLTSGDADGYIKIWDMGSNQLFADFHAHTQKIESISYNKSSSQLASCSLDTFLKKWDTQMCNTTNKAESEHITKVQDLIRCDSFPTVATLHYVRFCRNDLLLAVGMPQRIEDTHIM